MSFTTPHIRRTGLGEAATSRIYASAESVALRRCYPVNSARSALGFLPSEVFTSSASAVGATPQPPLLGFGTTLDGRNHPSSCLLCKVSENRRGRTLSFERTPPSMGSLIHACCIASAQQVWDPDRHRSVAPTAGPTLPSERGGGNTKNSCGKHLFCDNCVTGGSARLLNRFSTGRIHRPRTPVLGQIAIVDHAR